MHRNGCGNTTFYKAGSATSQDIILLGTNCIIPARVQVRGENMTKTWWMFPGTIEWPPTSCGRCNTVPGPCHNGTIGKLLILLSPASDSPGLSLLASKTPSLHCRQFGKPNLGPSSTLNFLAFVSFLNSFSSLNGSPTFSQFHFLPAHFKFHNSVSLVALPH